MQTLPPPVDELVGKRLGHYDVEQLLGYGNVNAVYAAQQQPQNRAVMLTAFTMPETFSIQARERFMTRFTQEASALLRLNHPHILPVYDFGEQFGYPYLVTPFVAGGSLAKILKQESRCTPERVLPILKQIAEGLDYAHKNGVVHGILKPANILLDNEQRVQIASFGLLNILKMRGVEQIDHPYAHLISIAGAFLGTPEYTAPEVIQGAPVDERSDVYSLGIVLFELLTGKLPFTGNDPFAIASLHVQQPVPSLQTFCPDLLLGLDLVVQRALERNPAQRFQSAGKLASAFGRVLSVILKATTSADLTKQSASLSPEITMPPTVNWFDEDSAANEGRVKPPALTRHLLAALSDTSPKTTAPQPETGQWQLKPPVVTGRMPAIEPPSAQKSSLLEYAKTPVMPETTEGKKDIDPFVWWSASVSPDAEGTQPGTFKQGHKKRSKAPGSQGQPANKSRRRAIVMLATGGVVAAGVLGAGGIGLARFLQMGHPQTAVAQPTATATTQINPMKSSTPTSTKSPTKTAPTPRPKATQPPPPPTPQPVPPTKPPQPTHTGMVIGMTSQGTNSAKGFNNPADGNGSVLVHLPNGNFAAYESACTHEGVTVYYNSSTQKLVCPRHGATFDPANNGQVLQGPAPSRLPAVQIRVNGDGTVTTG